VHAGRWWGAGWDDILFRLLMQAPDKYNWSEYTLYWTTGCLWKSANGSSALERLHFSNSEFGNQNPSAEDNNRHKLLYSEQGFEWGDWKAFNPELAFSSASKALFVVLQSNSGVDPKWANNRVAPFLAAAIAEHTASAKSINLKKSGDSAGVPAVAASDAAANASAAAADSSASSNGGSPS